MRLPLLILHILAGSIGLLTGTVAMCVRKGGKLHRASGNAFTAAMLTLATSAFCLAILKSQRGNIVGNACALLHGIEISKPGLQQSAVNRWRKAAEHQLNQ